jgi:hypothetical protein
MYSKGNNNSLSGKLAERIAIVPLLFAMVLGTSLIKFNEILFPPKVARLDFWAFSVVYLAAFSSWFGWHEAAYAYPYTRKPIVRLRAALEAMVALSWAALLFMASQATVSLFGYLWGFVIIFGIHTLAILVRRLEWRLLEAGYQPLRGTIIHGLLMLVASTVYSIWVLFFAPIPTLVIWVFVFVPLAILVSYRWPQMLRELPRTILEEQSPKTPEDASLEK